MKLEIRERETAIRLVELLVSKGICTELNSCFMEEFAEREMYNLGFGFSDGLTKGCFWHNDLCDWVIKFGYRGSLHKDYARAEYENYVAAVNANLDWYFPFTDFLGEFGGVEFFIQERADCSEETVTGDWYDKLLAYHEEKDDKFDFEGIWDEVYALEDAEKIELMFNDWALSSFLSARKIGDFHEGNFGYIGDRTVIIDFSGYAG